MHSLYTLLIGLPDGLVEPQTRRPYAPVPFATKFVSPGTMIPQSNEISYTYRMCHFRCSTRHMLG